MCAMRPPGGADVTEPVSIAHHQAQAARDLARLHELAAAARTARDLEHRQRVASETLDALCFHRHEEALPIAAIARHAKMSERDVYVRIDRHRGTLSA